MTVKKRMQVAMNLAFDELARKDDELLSRICVPAGQPEKTFLGDPWDGETFDGIPVKADSSVPHGTVFLVKDGEVVAYIYNVAVP